MEKISFRLSDDYADVAAIHDALYTWNLTKTGGERVAVQAQRFPEQAAFLACDDSGAAHGGIAFHWLNDPRRVFVDYFFLDDAVRGTGVGRKNMQFFMDWAERNGAREIELTTNSFQAPEFYRKMGFEITESKKEPQPLRPDNLHYFLRKVL